MKYRRQGSRLFIRLEKGEKVHAALRSIAEREGVTGGFVSGLGAVREVELGYYDLARKDYDRKSIAEEVEIASASGTLSLFEGKPHLHLHAVVSDRECRAYGGHVFSATAAATVEFFVEVSETPIERTPDAETGLNLWRV